MKADTDMRSALQQSVVLPVLEARRTLNQYGWTDELVASYPASFATFSKLNPNTPDEDLQYAWRAFLVHNPGTPLCGPHTPYKPGGFSFYPPCLYPYSAHPSVPAPFLSRGHDPTHIHSAPARTLVSPRCETKCMPSSWTRTS